MRRRAGAATPAGSDTSEPIGGGDQPVAHLRAVCRPWPPSPTTSSVASGSARCRSHAEAAAPAGRTCPGPAPRASRPARRVAEQAAVLDPEVVVHVVGDQSCEAEREHGIAEALGDAVGRRPVRGHRLPCAPSSAALRYTAGSGSCSSRRYPATGSSSPALSGKPVPLLGEHHAHAAAEQPVGLAPAPGGDAPQHQLGDPLGVLLGVGERQLTPERPAPHQPAGRCPAARAAPRCRRSGAAWCWPRAPPDPCRRCGVLRPQPRWSSSTTR